MIRGVPVIRKNIKLTYLWWLRVVMTITNIFNPKIHTFCKFQINNSIHLRQLRLRSSTKRIFIGTRRIWHEIISFLFCILDKLLCLIIISSNYSYLKQNYYLKIIYALISCVLKLILPNPPQLPSLPPRLPLHYRKNQVARHLPRRLVLALLNQCLF